jgi:hypothetical protein
MTTSGSFRRHWRDIATTFLKLGVTSYGGPAIMGTMQTDPKRSVTGSLSSPPPETGSS